MNDNNRHISSSSPQNGQTNGHRNGHLSGQKNGISLDIADTLNFADALKTRVQETADPHAQSMQQSVTQALERFWDTLEGDQPSNLYDLVINLIERPLLETVMGRCEQNQSRAATCLGITRSTLRKKLRIHGLIDT